MNKILFLILIYLGPFLFAESLSINAKPKITVCCINKNTGEPVTAASTNGCENACKSLGQAATYPHLKTVECGRNKKTGSPVLASLYDGQKKEIHCVNACKNICKK